MQSLQLALAGELAKLAEAEKENYRYGYDDLQAEYKKRVAAVANARLAIERLHDDARRAACRRPGSDSQAHPPLKLTNCVVA